MTELQLTIWLCSAAVGLGAATWLLRQQLRERRERRRMHEIEAQGLHIPPTLHPVIDPDRCISSAACVTACPEGDVLGLVGGAGRLIHGAACIGHGRCAAECPVDAIRLVFGTAERGVDIPYLTADFETNRPGLYIAGELGGMGLIRNAIRQGAGAARHAISSLAQKAGDAATDIVDVLVVGAGPAGIGAGLACIEAGARYRIIEQQSIGGTVAHYPRHKVVMTEPVEVPLFGRIHRATMTKEELLHLWNEVIAETGLQVDTGIKLEGVQGGESGEPFQVETSAGTIAARKVLLCIGRHGTPRKLGVEGESSPRVTYSLTDPQQYGGMHVLVVGGGDSALEAASALCENGVTVSLSYRGASFYRAKAANREAVEALGKAGKIRIFYNSQVQRLDPTHAFIQCENEVVEVEAEYVIAALGGEPPSALLKALGVRLDRWFGEHPSGAGHETHLAVRERRGTLWGWLGYGLTLATLTALALLIWYGGGYYQLGEAAREGDPLHPMLRPAGLLGHGIGLFATAVMFTNFLYAARKRLRPLQRFGGMRAWLTVHVWIGALAPALIAFHAAFRSNNLLATLTYWSVAAVLITGIVGRYVYGRIQAGTSFSSSVGGAAAGGLKRFLRLWRMGHVVLAVMMVLLILAHIAISFLFGYRWIFS